MSIEEKINFYKENLDCFEETMDKYKYLLDQGKKSKPFPEDLPNEINLSKGLITVDEQSPSGNLASCIFEGYSHKNLFPKILVFE